MVSIPKLHRGAIAVARTGAERSSKVSWGRIESLADCISQSLVRGRTKRGPFEERTLKNFVVTLLIAFLPQAAPAQKSAAPSPAQVAHAVWEYRLDNEDRIVRELSEFLAIPNVASDTAN